MRWLLIALTLCLLILYFLLPAPYLSEHESSPQQDSQVDASKSVSQEAQQSPTASPRPPTPAPIKEYYVRTDKNGVIHLGNTKGGSTEAPRPEMPKKVEPPVSPTRNQAVPPYVTPPVYQQVAQGRSGQQKAVPPNITLAMNAAANANSGLNAFESCRCKNGLATNGDSMQEVMQKCDEPVAKSASYRSGCAEIWLYNFGPNEFMQAVCFHRGRVSKVISLDHGY
ncbi:DUF2845 domain-containing protein [Geomonas sp. Red32]|uniref:DUF2845 domain-containing protein n=1 Tax=Geomonas sp. Red32 TaxID=2912856 RepID=UPI00202CD0D5|nr:DUF2845 domain-containing protein [Geomonas sp. Red32]MCM0081329.1 DUF2845 domain-containing protein [Geomonas sp. Red32]